MVSVNVLAGEVGRQGRQMFRSFGKLIEDLINLGKTHLRRSLAAAREYAFKVLINCKTLRPCLSSELFSGFRGYVFKYWIHCSYTLLFSAYHKGGATSHEHFVWRVYSGLCYNVWL